MSVWSATDSVFNTALLIWLSFWICTQMHISLLPQNPQGNNEGHALEMCECEWMCRPHYKAASLVTHLLSLSRHCIRPHTYTQTLIFGSWHWSCIPIFFFSLPQYLSVFLSVSHPLWPPHPPPPSVPDQVGIRCDNVLIGGCYAGQRVLWWSQRSIHRLNWESQCSDSSFISVFHP